MQRYAQATVGLAAVSSVLLAGCGTTYSLKEFSPTEGAPKTAFVDIKQRAVLSANRPAGSDGSPPSLVSCAEPSPDALSSFASEVGLDVKARDAVAASLALSQQEAASFVGLRTQSIQLLRDGMYRLCEGYMAGALTAADYAWLSRRYQKNMVALLTIEQLTRVAQVPALAQASQGMAAASRSATAIQADLEEIDKTKARLGDEKTKIASDLAEAQKLPDTDASKDAKVKALQQKQSDNQAAIGRADEVRAALLEGLKSAKGLLASGATTVQFFGEGRDARSAVSDTVSTAIKDLTMAVILQDDLGTLCFQMLAGSRSKAAMTPELATQCARIVETRALADELRLQEALVASEPRNTAQADSPPASHSPGAGDPLAKIKSSFLVGKLRKDAIPRVLLEGPVFGPPPQAPAAAGSPPAIQRQ